MTTTKPSGSTCEFCAAALTPTPNQWARGMRTTRKRFCNHRCSAHWKARDKRAEVSCPTCGKTFQAQKHRAEAGRRVFCSLACYRADHAATPLTCRTCGKEFVAKNYSKEQIYCSRECSPMEGASNPNYGKRHPGIFHQPADFRLRMSQERTGEGNPRWAGGSNTTGKFQHQSWMRNWAVANLGDACESCQATSAELHHIAPRRLFEKPALAHFRENLVMLCTLHHRRADRDVRRALADKQPRAIPFSDRLPESILLALEQGDSVSSPLPGCDYSPLGIEL